MELRVGERYRYTYEATNFWCENGTLKVVPELTVYFTVTREEKGCYHVLFENGCSNRFEKTSPMHVGTRFA